MQDKMIPLSLAVLGCGQMGTALAMGICRGKSHYQFHTFTPSFVRARELALAVQGFSYEKITQIPPCDYYIVACKPSQWEALAPELLKILSPKSVVVSLMAGVRMETLKKTLDGHPCIVRVMPNTACRVGSGVNLVYFSSDLRPTHRKEVISMLGTTGKVFPLEVEESIDYLIGVTSSGPALLFEMSRVFLEQLREWSPKGTDEKMCREMIQQTILGASLLMEDPTVSLGELRDQITSKGGVTEAALAVLAQGSFQELLRSALKAAHDRSRNLGEFTP